MILCSFTSVAQIRTIEVWGYTISYDKPIDAVKEICSISEQIYEKIKQERTPDDLYDDMFKHQNFYHDAIEALFLSDERAFDLSDLSGYEENNLRILTSADGKVKMVSLLYDYLSTYYQSYTNIVLYRDGMSYNASKLDKDYCPLEIFDYSTADDKYYLINFEQEELGQWRPLYYHLYAYTFDDNCNPKEENVFMVDGEISSYINSISREAVFNDEQEIIVYEENGREYPSGRLMVFKCDDGLWKVAEYRYDDEELKLYPSLLNFKHNLFTARSDKYTIRVDVMPDDRYRYASWKNKHYSQEPDLVLVGGTKIEGSRDIYSFVNGIYRYDIVDAVSWSHTPDTRRTLHIYKNDKLIQTITLD